MNETVILRKWCGKVASERAAEYARYMAEAGFPFVILGQVKRSGA